MYFHICNEVNVRNFELMGERSLLIRALEPSYKEKTPYKINNIDSYLDVLELYIDDTPNEKYVTLNSFNFNKALELNKFILENEFDEVVIHCALGMSRSPALMICVSKILGNKKLEELVKEKYDCYNQFIVEVFENFNYVEKDVSNNDVLGNVTLNVEMKEYLIEEEPGVYVFRLK